MASREHPRVQHFYDPATDVALLGTLGELREELAPLELVIAREADREIHEGRYHDGPSATVQLVGLRPIPSRPG